MHVNALAHALGIEVCSTENVEKSSVAERWNCTMKIKMFKHFTAKNTKKYIGVLDDFVERYNNTRHSSIKMTPAEASKKTNEVAFYRNLYPDFTRRPMRALYKIGDKFEFIRKRSFLKRDSPQTGQKKSSPFQKFKEQTRLLTK